MTVQEQQKIHRWLFSSFCYLFSCRWFFIDRKCFSKKKISLFLKKKSIFDKTISKCFTYSSRKPEDADNYMCISNDKRHHIPSNGKDSVFSLLQNSKVVSKEGHRLNWRISFVVFWGTISQFPCLRAKQRSSAWFYRY